MNVFMMYFRVQGAFQNPALCGKAQACIFKHLGGPGISDTGCRWPFGAYSECERESGAGSE